MVLTLLSESPPATLHAPARVGGLTPIATTSAGRVLVSDLGGEELAALGLGDAAAAVREARRDGFAIVREEFEPGLVAAAAPIRDASGPVVAALNVSAPRFRFDDRLESGSCAPRRRRRGALARGRGARLFPVSTAAGIAPATSGRCRAGA